MNCIYWVLGIILAIALISELLALVATIMVATFTSLPGLIILGLALYGVVKYAQYQVDKNSK